MSFLYITADSIGAPTGGGAVTYHEAMALQELGPCKVWGRDFLKDASGEEPWKWDKESIQYLNTIRLGAERYGVVRSGMVWSGKIREGASFEAPSICHFYAGTFPKTAHRLKELGTKIIWTIAAHDRFVSRKEHEKFGIDFAKLYPHLCEEALWQRYIEGYRLADVIVCPSTVAAKTVREYGPEFASKRIEVIPHGCELPTEVKQLPKQFVAGYMGSAGVDKGLIYLLQAWKQLNYKDAVLVLAGKDSTMPYVQQLAREYGGGNIWLRGWVDNISDFFNSISLYIQPSCTEGFGIEVIESLSYGRAVICSSGAGAVDLINDKCGRVCSPCDSKSLAYQIDHYKQNPILCEQAYSEAILTASRYTWASVRAMYQNVWRELLK